MSTTSSSVSTTPHSSLSPAPQFVGSASNSSSTSLSSHGSKSPEYRRRPVNVFSNDGSFLQRFQRIKKEEEDKKKAEDAANRKRHFEDRFRKRGKRPASEADVTEGSETVPPKKVKANEQSSMSQYQKELKSYNSSLKDNGNGVRPLVK
ncbi:hypothetical protein M422DRAFT_40646 [Sphaerobolus stellatus SS14]|nr:hypothetical protein M422DRAFT_40646 [Sphaerobolus stellatus SS14]